MGFITNGNIEIRRKGKRELVGQYAGHFIIHGRYRNDPQAQKEIDRCAALVMKYGRPNPQREYRNY